MWETDNPIIFMVSGFSDASLRRKTNIIYLWRPKNPQIIQEQIPNNFWKNMFINLRSLEIQNVGNVGKDAWRTIVKICLTFLNILNLGSIYSRKHAWTLGNVGWLNHWNFESLKLWNQETKKLKNQETKKPTHFFIFK